MWYDGGYGGTLPPRWSAVIGAGIDAGRNNLIVAQMGPAVNCLFLLATHDPIDRSMATAKQKGWICRGPGRVL